MSEYTSAPNDRTWPDYQTVWRWHFYAGLFTIPFVLILSITGTIYLFKPQIEAWREQEYDSIPALKANESFALLDQQIQSAVNNSPGSIFEACELPRHHVSVESSTSSQQISATRVLLRNGKQTERAYVNPIDSQTMYRFNEKDQFLNVVKKIHGELMLGNRGSYIVELAASWTLVMVFTGIAIWWPKTRFRLGGFLYPRLFRSGKIFWKDIHSVGGFWGSSLIVLLIVTGLPWATFWGDYFKQVRTWTGTAVVKQEWESGHENHQKSHGSKDTGSTKKKASSESGGFRRSPPPSPDSYRLEEINNVAKIASTLQLAEPVLIRPPSDGSSRWSVQSETANRPLRETLKIDALTGEISERTTFSDRHWVDQLVGQGIALHEGQRFGFANQLLALAATVCLVLLSMTGTILWWSRRKQGFFSPPPPSKIAQNWSWKRSFTVIAAIVTLGLYLPLFGASLLIILAIDRLIRSISIRQVPSNL